MINKYQPYSSYYYSGVEWVGNIPEDWEMWKLSHAYLNIGSGTTPSANEEKWYQGEIPWVTTGELKESLITKTNKYVSDETLKTYPTLRKYPVGSVVLAMYGATIGRLALLGIEATTNQACCVLPKSKALHNKYVYYWLQAFRNEIIQLSSGGGQPNINQEKVATLRISAPCVDLQEKIAKFLNYETESVDGLIKKQQKLIELLKEKRQAVISHAVTKGLEPNAPMKDSGLDWLSDIPKHWNTIAVKMCALKHNKAFTDGDWIESPYITDSGVRLLQTGNVGIGHFREKGFRYVSEDTFIKLKCTEIQLGDVLICRLDGPVGRACLVPNLENRMITSVDNAILKVSESIDARFIVYLMSSEPWLTWIQNLCRVGGGFRFRISRSMLGDQRIAVPSIQEQNKICDYLDKQMTYFEKVIEKSTKSIELLQERRTALISAAVTGKIDVRDWQPPTSSHLSQDNPNG